MKYTILTAVLISVLFGCKPTTTQTENTEMVVTEAAIIDVDALLGNPDNYVDKPVEVTGLVTHVCKHSGKRLHLTSSESNKYVRVEATGEINQFERELEGNNLVIKGTFHKQVINEEYLAKWESELKQGSAPGMHEHEADMEMLESSKRKLSESGQTEIVQFWVDGTAYSVQAAE